MLQVKTLVQYDGVLVEHFEKIFSTFNVSEKLIDKNQLASITYHQAN